MILKRRFALLLLFLLTFLALCFSCAKDGQAVAVSAPSQLRRCIALTFDDGPSPQTTATLLDGLKERGAHATFFLIGEQIAGNEDLVRRMKDEGHQVGSHSFTHVQLDAADAADLAALACAVHAPGRRAETFLLEVDGAVVRVVRLHPPATAILLR